MGQFSDVGFVNKMKFLYNLKKLFMVKVIFLVFCFGIILAFAQNQCKSDADKPDFRDPRLLIVMIYPDGKLALNKLPFDETVFLKEKLLKVFQARLDNGVFTDEMWDRNDVPDTDRVAKEVWILAASNLNDEKVATVVEAVKIAGASPIKMLTDVSYQNMLDEPPSTPEPLMLITPIKRKVKVRGKKTRTQ